MKYPYGDKYPDNLLDEIGISADGGALPEDFAGTLEYVLRTLTDREREIIDRRFRLKMSLTEIGKEYGVVRERVRQIEVKALRKLSYPTRRVILEKGIQDYYNFARARDAERDRQFFQDGYQKGFEDGRQAAIAERREIKPPPEETDESVPIETLDFSTRTYNALRRNNRRTLRDILNMSAEDYRRNVSNLGVKSYAEILGKLKSIGYDVEVLRRRLLGDKEGRT